jgi:hypothetical protein
MLRYMRQLSACRVRRYAFFTVWILTFAFITSGELMSDEGDQVAGKVTIIKLSTPQIALIEETHVLRLTPAQKNQLASEAGLAPTEFHVCDADQREGERACADWNRALRLSDRAVGIPHEYLVPDREAMRRKMALTPGG